MFAAHPGHKATAKMLLEHGANPTLESNDGTIALVLMRQLAEAEDAHLKFKAAEQKMFGDAGAFGAFGGGGSKPFVEKNNPIEVLELGEEHYANAEL